MPETTPEAFAQIFQALAARQGDACTIETDGSAIHIQQKGWRFAKDIPFLSTGVFEMWNGLWDDLLTVHNWFLVMEVLQRQDHGDACFEWRIRERH